MRLISRLTTFIAFGVGLSITIMASANGVDTEVTVGSNDNIFSQNKQNEPALAVDASHPNVLAAGANDNIDMEGCAAGDPTTCPFSDGVGGSGVQFSFDGGQTWIQPEYSGWTARHCLGPAECVGAVGPIGTLPWYYENGLVSDGDPAVAFGPQPDEDGEFSWDNGSRLYYANLASSFPGVAAFKGFEAIAVSRIDGDPALTPTIVVNKDNWKAPVIVSKQNSTLFSDKEQIWADNAASSPHFGNSYICYAGFRSQEKGRAVPAPLFVATSTDGGDSWRQRQTTAAVNNAQHFGQSGCTIRTDSDGVVYVFAVEFELGLPGFGSHIMIKSFDGGATWTRPKRIFQAVDTCNAFDAVIGRCVHDGVAGARNDLGPAPGIDIANGAPTGADATNEIIDTWVDGRDGLNNEHVFVSYSTNGGDSWSSAAAIERAGDRGYYSAPAISPNGRDAYIVYNAFTTPYRNNTTDPRGLVGVILHADIGAGGAPGAWSEVHRGATGDPRGSSQNNLQAEFLGDYVYGIATRTYGAFVWNDARNAADCPALDAWRAFLRGGPNAPKPAIQSACPANFGNTDIFGARITDPTP